MPGFKPFRHLGITHTGYPGAFHSHPSHFGFSPRISCSCCFLTSRALCFSLLTDSAYCFVAIRLATLLHSSLQYFAVTDCVMNSLPHIAQVVFLHA